MKWRVARVKNTKDQTHSPIIIEIGHEILKNELTVRYDEDNNKQLNKMFKQQICNSYVLVDIYFCTKLSRLLYNGYLDCPFLDSFI